MLSWLNAVRATSPSIGQRSAIKNDWNKDTAIMRKIKLVSLFITSSASCTEIDRRHVECTAENLLHAFFFFTFFDRCNTKMASRDKVNTAKNRLNFSWQYKAKNDIFFSAIFLRLSASLEKHTSPTLKHQIFPVRRIGIKEFILNMRILHSSMIYVCCYCATPEQLKQSAKIVKACKRPKAKKKQKNKKWHTSLWMSDCTSLMLCHALELALLLCTCSFRCKSSGSVIVCTHYVASTALILWQLPFNAEHLLWRVCYFF